MRKAGSPAFRFSRTTQESVMSINLTKAGLDQLLSELQEQGYRGTRILLEHQVMRASSTSGLDLLRAGLEQMVLEKRFTDESVLAFQRVVEHWSTRFTYATVRLDHNYRFDVLFWKPLTDAQAQESVRFFVSTVSGHGEVFMKLRAEAKPGRSVFSLDPVHTTGLTPQEPLARAEDFAPRQSPPELEPEPEPTSAPGEWARRLLEPEDLMGGE
jgi:hypothetical protein